ncbi:protein patched homolog 1 [Lingula anatina]|uniref:Protein patched homolog 1 n=1 Tax=Lingula anatina TaxID=7574 RepID=A0A1S3HBS8_LINAN|nr:protein patched homolog 1 [Lingula anatina]|eukprot:XP_013382604.1 protein patched homolog 1 [Lingula anatina]
MTGKTSDFDEKKEVKKNCSFCDCMCLRKVSNVIVNGLETAFYRLGQAIGTYPWVTILISIVFVALCGIGFMKFYQEDAVENLWVPYGSPSVDHMDWVSKYYPSVTRFQSMMVVDDNVLTPKVLNAMLDIDISIKAINSSSYNWTSICTKIFGSICWSSSLLELWSFNETHIRNLTQAEILDTVNNVTRSPVFFNDYNVSKVLGAITKDANGKIISAEATTMTYFINDESAESVDALAWEQQFIDIGAKGHAGIKEVNYYAFRTRSDEGGGAIFGDLTLLSVGYFLIIIFVAIVLGTFNCVEHRIWLALGCVLAVGMSIIMSFGLSSAFGVAYGPVHSVLPFLLLGIGVDDAFVIIQSWNNLHPHEKEKPLPDRVGLMLKHAGVAITVTSITDFVAFAIGATTILPALRSFCIFAALGILGLYIFQATFFVACHTINERRVEAVRNACCCCYPHRNYKPNQCSQKGLMAAFFKKYYASFLLKLPVKIIVLVATLGLLGVNVYGLINLKQDFDFNWFIPSDSYASKYTKNMEKFFPSDGASASIYFGEIDYYRNFSYLEEAYTKMSNSEYTYEGTVNSFFEDFKVFVNESTDNRTLVYLNANKWPSNETNFYRLLRAFILWVPSGRRYISYVNMTDTEPYKLKASQIFMKHKDFPDAQTEVKAMDNLRSIADGLGLPSDKCFAYSRSYLNWESNKVIQIELYRNIGLAFACVFLVTLILIANIWTCILVLTCVVMTLVDVGGLMYFWGLTIDSVTTVNTILAIGLAVDYAAHIGHMFMTELGTRNERAKTTIGDMGPAVFNGGFSTFLAFVLLAFSGSYVFQVFFKVFFGVVVYGLFHGLIYLPVILSWLGPAPYLSAIKEAEEEEAEDKLRMENGGIATVQGYENHVMYDKHQRIEPPPDYEGSRPYIPPPDYTPPSSPQLQGRYSNPPSAGGPPSYPASDRKTPSSGHMSRPSSRYNDNNINNGYVSRKASGHRADSRQQNALPNVHV